MSASSSSSSSITVNPFSGSNGDPGDLSRVTESLTNPYHVLRESAEAAMYPEIPKAFCRQLYALSAIYALVCLVALASVAVSYRRGNLRFIRRLETGWSDAALYVPASASVFPMCLALFAGLAQGYIWTLLGIDMRHNSQIDFVLWQTIIWLPLWFAGYALIWHIVFTADMSRMASSHFLEAGQSTRAPGIAAYLPSPKVTNLLLWSVPIVVGVVTIVPFAYANRAYNHLFYAWETYDGAVADAAEEFSGLINPRVTRRLSSLMEVMMDEFDETVRFLRGGYIAYTFFGLLLFMASLAMLLIMGRIMLQQVETLRAASLREETGEVAAVSPSYAERCTMLEARVRTFLMTVGSVTVVSGLYTAVSLSIVILPTTNQAMGSKHATSSRMLIGLWAFAVVGFIVTEASFYGAYQAEARSSGGISLREKALDRGMRPLVMPVRLQQSNSLRSVYSIGSLHKDVIVEVDESDWVTPRGTLKQ